MTFSVSMPRTLAAFVLLAAMSSAALGQAVVINEIVEDEQDFETGDVPDTREFVELYNPGATAIDISGWTLSVTDLGAVGTPVLISDAMPPGSMIAPGGYFVIGAAIVPNVNFTPAAGELWPNSNPNGTVWELRNPNLTGSTLVDAVGLDTFRGVELENASQEQLDQIAAGQTVGPNARGGWWGQIESLSNNPDDENFPNLPQSIARYIDGRDRNINGYDFGMIPATPGASNALPQAATHVVPDVTSLAVGSVLKNEYYASFKLPYVFDPAQVGPAGLGGQPINPNIIPASPQGGKAIIAYDETGGGNAVYSKSYVNKFEISAFIDPRPLNAAAADTAPQSEATIYGIGTTDPLFGTPNSADLLTGLPGGNVASSSNGSTGLGWLIQRREIFNGGSPVTNTVLQLLDMNDGGDGVIADNDWQIKATYDLTGMTEAWHTLSIDYDPATGNVTAKFDAQTTTFMTAANLVGTFYAGYRENLPGAGIATMRPPTFDLVVAAPANDADFNNDDEVDGRDFLIWQRGLGPGTNATGDANGDGQVNGADLEIWKGAYASATPVAGAVPEPAAWLSALGASALLLHVRKRGGTRQIA